MFGFYLASAIIGWAFVGLFLFGGIDADVDADFDADLESADFDADLDADLAETSMRPGPASPRASPRPGSACCRFARSCSSWPSSD